MTDLRSRLTGHRNPIALTLVALLLLSQAGVVWDARTAGFDPGDAVFYEVWPLSVRMAGWLATGVVALIMAWTPWRQWGWAVAIIMPAQRIAAHAWSFAHWLIPGYPPGLMASAAWTVTWAALTGLILLVAGWADTAPSHPEAD